MMPRATFAVALFSAVLCGCGGGGGGSAPSGGITFSGTVATGEPLAGATVVVVHESGQAAFAVTDAAGRYSATFPPGNPVGRPLYIVQTTNPLSGPSNAPATYPRLYSIANRNGGTVNVTPLTSLLVARLIGSRQGAFIDLAMLHRLPTPSDAEISAARNQVLAYLLQRPNRNDETLADPVDASAVVDFIGGAFNAVAGDTHDDAIERLAQTLMEGETIEGVEEHMLSRNDPPADLTAILSLDFDADCVAEGTAHPAVPAGRVHVSLMPTGQITFAGSASTYSYTILPGDTIRRSNRPFFDDFWQIQPIGSGTGDLLELWQTGKMLSSIVLIRSSGGATRCTPSVELPLGARAPSLLAQVRALDTSLANPTSGFTCPAGTPGFPGVNDGANFLAITPNGALRVAAGHTLHLPSLGVDLSAEFVNNAGALGTRVRSAGFARSFVGGFDLFGIALDAGGNITTINFGQQRNGEPSISKTCP